MSNEPRMRGRSPRALKKVIEKDDGEVYFCPLPFEHLYNDNGGRWRLCCRAYPFEHTVSDTTPEEHWKHPLMERIRREMLSGELGAVRKHCWKCLKVEKEGIVSPRQQLNASFLEKAERNRYTALQVASRMTEHPEGGCVLEDRVLELKLRVFGNYCNLRCYMCAPVNSTSRLNELEQIDGGCWLSYLKPPERPEFFETEDDYDRFVESALRLLPFTRKIKITGGEPFLLRRHYKFLERVVASGQAPGIRLAYDSNMTQFRLGSENVLDYLKHFKGVTLAVSVDNIGPRNDYIRYGSVFGEVIANIDIARAWPGINVVLSCATGILNAGDVHDIAEFFHARGLVAKFNMCVIMGPTFLQARHLPDALKERYLGQIENSPHRNQFENVVGMLRQPRDEAEFQTFPRYINALDAHRGTNYLDLWPEFAPYQEAYLKPAATPESPILPVACPEG